MNNPVGYFEVPVHDLDRACAFYERVFACRLSRTTIDDHEMALFAFDESLPDISGALAKGDSYVPGPAGVRIYFRVVDIDATLERVRSAGGRVTYPKTAVGEGMGQVAEFEDSEGNIIALHAR